MIFFLPWRLDKTKGMSWMSQFVAKAVSFNDVAIVFVNRNDYRHKFWNNSKTETVNKMKNDDLNEKGLG